MTLYVCLDDKNGMLFNKRRQSRDGVVLEDIRASVSGVLTVGGFSEKLIAAAGIPYAVGEPAPGVHFFLENRKASEILPMAEKIVIYRWNRVYPADFRFDGDLSGFTLESTDEFSGKSHEKITKEVYVR